jgi:hypothetical protein
MTVFFTICSKNFLAQALTLHESLRAAHGPIRFYLALCDAPAGWDTLSLPFPVIEIDSLGIPEWDWMRQQYNITELNTALKPFAFQYIFDKHPGADVVYLDPDIFVTSPLAEVLQGLAAGASCVLTPHILEPAEFAEFDDQKFLQYGVYNLGFCAFKDTPQVRRVVSWWGRRLEKQCVIDLPSGLFVDQKWADLFPAYLDRTLVLRHCGYNVGYWNLSQRRIWREGGRWMCNDGELRFAHFSGHAVGSPIVFSRHAQSFNRKNVGELARLLEHYEARLRANGHAYFSTLPYGFNWNGAKGQNLHTPESARAAASAGPGDPAEAPRWIPLARETSFAEHAQLREAAASVADERRKVELALLPKQETPFRAEAFCALCGGPSEFQVGFMYASRRTAGGVLVPNWREHLDCARCKLVNRVRASLHIFLQEFRPDRRAAIYLTEQVTPTYRWLKERFPKLQGSEYLPGTHAGGEVVNGVQHEDLQQLSFPSGSFDYILSFDVLEHVPFEQKAFREMFRCLKPGGRLLFTAPFTAEIPGNTVRAVMEEGGVIRHLTEPEYHGNPVDPEGGALAYRYFGWECLEQLAAAGFRAPAALGYWSRDLAYLGEHQYVFVAEKSDAQAAAPPTRPEEPRLPAASGQRGA